MLSSSSAVSGILGFFLPIVHDSGSLAVGIVVTTCNTMNDALVE